MTAPSSNPQLTDRELAVLHAVANGSSYRELATRWGITEITVRGYGHRLMAKLGANSIAHAVHLGHNAGLLQWERHGRHAGFAAHVRAGEEPCDRCLAGERAYQAGRRAARRSAKEAA